MTHSRIDTTEVYLRAFIRAQAGSSPGSLLGGPGFQPSCEEGPYGIRTRVGGEGRPGAATAQTR
jgi:hypothetical protein